MKFNINDIDLAITKAVQSRQHREYRNLTIKFYKFFSDLLSPFIIIFVFIILLALVTVKNIYFKEMTFITLAVLPTILSYQLKKIIKKPRPDHNKVIVWVNEKSANFPSSHATMATSIFGFLIFLLVYYQIKFYLFFSIALGLLIFLISYSRIFLGAHFFSDVIGGITLGGLFLPLYSAMYVSCPNAWFSESIIWLLVIIGIFFVRKYYKKHPEEVPRFLTKSFLKEKSEIITRILTSIIFIIMVVIPIIKGGYIFFVLMCLFALECLYEIFKVKTQGIFSKYIYAIFVIFMIGALTNLRFENNGIQLLILVALIAAISDISGYVIGKLFGSKKIFPHLSPNKTLEGTIAALFGPAIILSIVYLKQIFMGNFALPIMIFILSLSAICGDLLESYFKRKMAIKDFPTLIPGHGGLLDRIDSSLMVSAILWILIKFNITIFI